jgi:hypothetical protein
MLSGMDSFVGAFERFTGGIHPLPVLLVAALLAAVLLKGLEREGFRVRRPGSHKGLLQASALAVGLALIMVCVDVVSPYAADLNVPFPTSLLFYPAIGFVAEVAFHLVPLAALLLVLRPLAPRVGPTRTIGAAILVVALVEPAFQVALAGPQTYPAWQIAYMTAHIYALNVLQLWVFRRYDFLSMYVVRLAYYLVWHIVWGHLRLGLLF